MRSKVWLLPNGGELIVDTTNQTVVVSPPSGYAIEIYDSNNNFVGKIFSPQVISLPHNTGRYRIVNNTVYQFELRLFHEIIF